MRYHGQSRLSPRNRKARLTQHHRGDLMPDLNHDPDLGYIFFPREQPDHIGFPRLDVIIPAKPTYRHFDPQNAKFQIVSASHDIEHIIVHHPWSLDKHYHVCAGRIYAADRNAKQFEAFSLGGQLEIATEIDRTVCALTSNAPIFPVTPEHDLPMWIVTELEILLAQQRAHWDPQHPHAFETHLSTVDPFTLYASCLQALQAKSAQPGMGITESDHHGYHFVDKEITWLQKNGEWPILVPPLDKLLNL
ncbi:MAG: hypothetical protein M9928_06890 [Anaerolineae bacterium]|nr:hypothetical protein [Anaerolineae bacterium]MCO5190857.1 hypothetical protein [Anaerolineae bacterium]MCO5194184.1 hypothetical protein [Anaerolineae bacterium]MCO5204738.1 hypothetical protein [Anaerolineae bacterium]